MRIPWNDAILAKRVLEMGPDGIVFPMVNTAEEAKRAMDACLYPPLGTRGFGPFRAIAYGMNDIDAYIAEGSLSMCRFVQVETAEAVENLEAKARVLYVDGFILGPCDLSGSFGMLNRAFEGETDRLINLAIQKAHSAGRPIGVSTGSDKPDVLAHWLNKGVDFISAGTDAWGILSGAVSVLKTLREIDGRQQAQAR